MSVTVGRGGAGWRGCVGRVDSEWILGARAGVPCARKSFFQKTLEGGGRRIWSGFRGLGGRSRGCERGLVFGPWVRCGAAWMVGGPEPCGVGLAAPRRRVGPRGGSAGCGPGRGTTVGLAGWMRPGLPSTSSELALRGHRDDGWTGAAGIGPGGWGRGGALRARKSFFQKTLEGGGARISAETGRLRGRFGRGGMGGLGSEETVGWGARADGVRR